MGDNQESNYYQDQQYNYDPNMYNQQQQVIYQVPVSETYYEDDDDYENLEAIEQVFTLYTIYNQVLKYKFTHLI